MQVTELLRLAHILSFVFMSAPFYSLIVVNERGKIPGAVFKVDRYLENMISGQSKRCYVFQFTALITGLLLVRLGGMGLSSIFTNPALGLKTLLLLTLIGLLSVVHFYIQPRIEAQLSGVTGDAVPEEVMAKIRPLRIKRKKLAAFCLFLVLSTIILGIQVTSPLGAALNAVLFPLAAVFSWRVYKIPVAYGWL